MLQQTFCGAGLEGGADLLSYRQYVQSLGQTSRGRQLAELMVSIATGSFWTQQRKFEATLAVSDTCLRCREAVDTPVHRC